MNLDNIKLTDLIDIKTLQDIQDGFANATGMAALTTDENGTAITEGSNFTDFCMNLTRKSLLGCQRCENCDRQGGENTMRTGKAYAYTCHAGLVDFAAPIMLNGKFIGSFIGGQVLPNAPDENQLRKYANEIGIDPDEYIKAIRKVKVIPKKQIDSAADFLCTIANVLSKTAYCNYLEKINASETSHLSADTIIKVHDAEELVRRNSIKMNKLKDEFTSLESIAQDSVSRVNSTMETVKVIQDVATNTRILGFNAYIEASHAKENGKGFGVITQEIRNLADTSMESADKIGSAIRLISNSTKQIDEQVKNTQKIINECMEDINDFSRILSELSNE